MLYERAHELCSFEAGGSLASSKYPEVQQFLGNAYRAAGFTTGEFI